MSAGLFGRHRRDRHSQASADRLRDLPNRHALFGDRVAARPGKPLLEDEPVQAGGIDPVHRRPAIEPVTDVGGHPLLPSDSDRAGGEAFLVLLDGTTILGMAPLLFGPFFASMAVTIMAGLGFASVLPLIGVPAIHHPYAPDRGAASGKAVREVVPDEAGRRRADTDEGELVAG